MDSSATLLLSTIFPLGDGQAADPAPPDAVALDMSSLDDRGLMERVVDGDPDAFATLYRRYERPLFNFLLRVTRNRRPLAEDLLQETFTRVWRAARTWDPGRGPARSWLYKIALNAARSELARKVHRAPHEALDAGGHELREEKRLQRLQAVEKARSYLEELAAEITAMPVDPTIVGEVQARYFEEIAQGRRFVWGMGADGEFLFGVPREGFARLNTAWNAHEASIVGEGAFVDRQDFLRQLVQESEHLDLADLAPNPDDPDDTPWSGLRRYGDRDDWMVFSAPLKADDGSALGNLYLKMEDLEGRWEPWTDSDAEKLRAGAAGVCGFTAIFLWFLLPTWVYVDARERGVRRAMLWSFLVLISVFVGLVVYLIARPEETTLKCPGCEREVNGGAYCPHCGHDLSSAFCATCRYPLKPDWGFCPSCRTEVGRSPAGEAPAEEADATPATENDTTPENG